MKKLFSRVNQYFSRYNHQNYYKFQYRLFLLFIFFCLSLLASSYSNYFYSTYEVIDEDRVHWRVEIERCEQFRINSEYYCEQRFVQGTYDFAERVSRTRLNPPYNDTEALVLPQNSSRAHHNTTSYDYFPQNDYRPPPSCL